MFGRNIPPDPFKLNHRDLSDYCGELAAIVAEATAEYRKAKNAAIATGESALEGERFRVTISPATTQQRLDTDKVKAYLEKNVENWRRRFLTRGAVAPRVNVRARKPVE